MNYKTALEYILSFADYERLPRSAFVFDLRRMFALLEKLGNPQDAAKSVHISGTKGKGSTSAMIASILTNAGFRTGLYTSPHLLDIRERIQIGGKCIFEKDFARFAGLVRPQAEAVNKESKLGQLTTFELLTALAFIFFKELKVDYEVLEVGLGGRLDATNVVKPQVCVLTSISFDHMDVLGDTLAKIAGEKAGIIKPGSVVVSAPQAPEAMEVIERTCRGKGVRLVKIGADVTWQRKSFSPEGQVFELNGLKKKYELNVPLLGEYQLENAASAVTVAEILSDLGTNISEQAISKGISDVRWPGRLQVLKRKPWMVIDGAHNTYSIKKLGEALRQYFTFEKLIFVFGASSDKDISGMVAEIAQFNGEVIVTRSRHPRSLEPIRLAGEFARKGVAAHIAEDVTSALELARSMAKPTDLICAAGSLFIVAEVLEKTPGAAICR